MSVEPLTRDERQAIQNILDPRESDWNSNLLTNEALSGLRKLLAERADVERTVSAEVHDNTLRAVRSCFTPEEWEAASHEMHASGNQSWAGIVRIAVKNLRRTADASRRPTGRLSDDATSPLREARAWLDAADGRSLAGGWESQPRIDITLVRRLVEALSVRRYRVVHDATCEHANEIVGEETPRDYAGEAEIVRPRVGPRGTEIRVARPAVCTCGASKTVSVERSPSPLQDLVCEHGTALDVHCCNCHEGFIFDRDHVCPNVCQGCGGRYTYDTSVPSAVWNSVIRARGLPEYLCAACILKAFARVSKSFTAVLSGEGVDGLHIEVRISGPARDLDLVQEENNRLRVELREAEERFTQHTSAVGAFLNELYAVMVDPCADVGATISVAEMQKALLNAAVRDRDRSVEMIPIENADRLVDVLSALSQRPVCDLYKRPSGTLGGPCDECGASQPEHVNRLTLDKTPNWVGKKQDQ